MIRFDNEKIISLSPKILKGIAIENLLTHRSGLGEAIVERGITPLLRGIDFTELFKEILQSTTFGISQSLYQPPIMATV